MIINNGSFESALAMYTFAHAAPTLLHCAIEADLPPAEECLALRMMQTNGNTSPKEITQRAAEILPKISPRLAKKAQCLADFGNIKVLSSDRHPTYIQKRRFLWTSLFENALCSVSLRKQDTAAATANLANALTYFFNNKDAHVFTTAIPQTAELLAHRHQEQSGMIEKRVEPPIIDFASIVQSLEQEPTDVDHTTQFFGSLVAVQFSDMIMNGELKFDDLLDDKNPFPTKFKKFGVTPETLLNHTESYINEQKKILDRYDDSKPMNRKQLVEIYLR